MINNIEIFLNFNIKKKEIDFFVYEFSNEKTIYSKNLNFLTYHQEENIIQNNNEDNLRNVILDIERKFNSTVSKINLMVERDYSTSIDLSFKKNFENKTIKKKEIEFIVQDLRLQLIKNNPDKKFIHILIKKCLVNDEEFYNIPIGINCKNLVIETSFIYLSKKFIKNFEALLSKNQIEIKKLICTNYARSLLDVEYDKLSVAGMKVISNSNLNEVHILSKDATKPGYFERLFNIFS